MRIHSTKRYPSLSSEYPPSHRAEEIPRSLRIRSCKPYAALEITLPRRYPEEQDTSCKAVPARSHLFGDRQERYPEPHRIRSCRSPEGHTFRIRSCQTVRRSAHREGEPGVSPLLRAGYPVTDRHPQYRTRVDACLAVLGAPVQYSVRGQCGAPPVQRARDLSRMQERV